MDKPIKQVHQSQSAVDTRDKTVGLGILGLGGGNPKGSTAVKMSTEAEALRQDPLKNYPDDQKIAAED